MEIAVVNITRLLDESKRGKELSAELRTIADDWRDRVDEVEQKIREARERLEGLGEDAAAEVSFGLQRDISILELERRSLVERQRADIEGHREHFRARMLEEIKPVLAAAASEQGLKVVMSVSGNELAYVADDADITALVMTKLDSD